MPELTDNQIADLRSNSRPGIHRLNLRDLQRRTCQLHRGKRHLYDTAIVPTGATTGPVVVITPSGGLASNKTFRVTE
jgi:hypothetical protein